MTPRYNFLMTSVRYLCAVLLLAGLPWGQVLAGKIPVAVDLQQDANASRAGQVPILLIYTAEYCHYCDEVKQSVFNLIFADPAYQDRILLREVRTDTNLHLVGFSGTATSHRSFSKNRGIRIVPTLEFLDSTGAPISPPLVGAGIPDYYGAYVDNGIEQSLRNLRARQDPS